MAEFPVSIDLDVRFRDCDPMGHVNNAVYATYLEVGRQAYWSRFLEGGDFLQARFIVARLEIDYRSAATVGERVRVSLRVSWIGRHSFGVEYEVREIGSARLLAEARTVQATYDYGSRRVIPVPENLRRELERVEGRPLPAKGEDHGNQRS